MKNYPARILRRFTFDSGAEHDRALVVGAEDAERRVVHVDDGVTSCWEGAVRYRKWERDVGNCFGPVVLGGSG